MLKTLKNRKGQVTIMFILLCIVLFGFIGLAIDLGIIINNKRDIQNGLDMTILASMQEIANNSGLVESASINYANKNGIKASELTINYPYSGDNNKVELYATRTIKLPFLSILGYKTKTISARTVGVSEKKSINSYIYDSFNYALFNGSVSNDLQIKGNSSLVKGNVHSNSSISVVGNKHTFSGDISAVGTIDFPKNANTGTVTTQSDYVPMPSFDFDLFSSMADVVYNEDLTLNGNKTIEGVWLVNGNVHISGLRVSGQGIILATGEIQISGSLEYNTSPVYYIIATPIDADQGTYQVIDGQSVIYNTYGDILALYSLTDIHISGVDTNINGVLYAPNGTIRINGSGNTFNGALIADQVVWATNETTINGTYDIRTPQSIVVEKDVFRIIE